MQITAIEQMTKHKVRVFLDGEPAFVFTDKEICEWELREGEELDGEKLGRLMQYIDRMAARTAMELLMRRDYSEAELRGKLLRKGFGQEAAERGTAYVQNYHYLDDERYARQFIAGRKGTASRQMVVFKLKQKGIQDAVIRSAMDEADWDDMDGIIYELRRHYGSEFELSELSEKERQKFYQSLVRKGYHFSDIRRIFSDDWGGN